ncbi:MAG: FAD-dependent oxidoreductase, partial [Dehalococcoidales bacterium]
MVISDPVSRPLATGSRVAVVGGGPAGSLFTLYLLRYAEERGFRPDVTIYQDRDFTVPGPGGCKGCAGILSVALLRNLAELGLTVPDEVVRGHIEHYAVHSPYTTISINNPEEGATIVSVYRGGGPRDSNFSDGVAFDGWLLDEAVRRGASLRPQRVSTIDLDAGPRLEVAGEMLEYDLVVLAGGVNERHLTVTGGHTGRGGTGGYRSPLTSTMAQAELYAGEDEVRERLGNTAHAFLIPHSDIIFGTLVPKGPFINVSVLSSGQRPVSVADLLAIDIVGDFLPEHYERACDCQPRALLTPAGGYYGDGFVAVGDAAVSRLYKDGIGSALLTASEAARAAVFHGVSRESFRRHYRPLYRRIGRDNRWGRLLFTVNQYVLNSRAFLLAQQRLIGDEQAQTRGPQPFTRVVWGMFTGSYSYSRMVRMAVRPTVLARLVWGVLREAVAGWFRRGAAAPRRIYVAGRKVLILGSGFGGTYVLRSLVPALNRNENVETTMVSDENFFLFSPLLHEVAMGAVETRHAAYAIRRLQWRDRFNFVQSNVDKIDLANRLVTTSQGVLTYDYLVVALGSIADTSQLNCPAAADHVFTLKTLHDSMRIRNHIIGLFERACVETDPAKRRQLLTFVISGGGYIGVQVVT